MLIHGVLILAVLVSSKEPTAGAFSERLSARLQEPVARLRLVQQSTQDTLFVLELEDLDLTSRRAENQSREATHMVTVQVASLPNADVALDSLRKNLNLIAMPYVGRRDAKTGEECHEWGMEHTATVSCAAGNLLISVNARSLERARAVMTETIAARP